MNSIKLNLKELVKTYRERKEISQLELSVMLKVSSKTIWNIENITGVAEKQSLEFWKEISRILEIPKEEIF